MTRNFEPKFDRYEIRTEYVQVESYFGDVSYIWDTILEKRVTPYYSHTTFIDPIGEREVDGWNKEWQKEFEAATKERDAIFFSNYHYLPFYLTGKRYNEPSLPYDDSEYNKEKWQIKQDFRKIREIQTWRKIEVFKLYLKCDSCILQDVTHYNNKVKEDNLVREKYEIPVMQEITLVVHLINAFNEIYDSLKVKWDEKKVGSKDNIPFSVTSIGNHAFEGCVGLSDIVIPISVESIGDGVFSGCSGLKNVAIPDSITSIPQFAFFECSSLKK